MSSSVWEAAASRRQGGLGHWPLLRTFWRPGRPGSGYGRSWSADGRRPGLQVAVFSWLLRTAQSKEGKHPGVPLYGRTDPTHEDATLTTSVPKASPLHASHWECGQDANCPVTPGVRLDTSSFTTQGRRFTATRSLLWPRWVSPGLWPRGPHPFPNGARHKRRHKARGFSVRSGGASHVPIVGF